VTRTRRDAKLPGFTVLLALVATLAGCDGDAPGSLLDGPRVIAVIADPPTVAVNGVARVELISTIDGFIAAPDAVAWRACSPRAVIVDPVRDCAGDAALALEVDEHGRAIVDVAVIAARFGIPLPPAMDDPCGRQVLGITIVVEVQLAGSRLIARKQLWVGASPPPRQNPAFVHVLADGVPLADGATAARGVTLTIGADLAVDSLDLVCSEGASEPSRRESVRVAVYAGGGVTASDTGFEVVDQDGATRSGTVDLTLPSSAATVPLWLVAIDEGGGAAATHLVIEVR
jgi:hypothetical protein